MKQIKIYLIIAIVCLVLGMTLQYALQVKSVRSALAQSAELKKAAGEAAVREAQLKNDRTALAEDVSRRDLRLADLESQLAHRPVPPTPISVPPDATLAQVRQDLMDLGLTPTTQPPSTISLLLPDGRAVVGWGRDALRVPGLSARLTTLEDFHTECSEQNLALKKELSKTLDVVAAADQRASLEEQRAEASDKALRNAPKDYPWTVIPLFGRDSLGASKLGGSLSCSYGRVTGQVVVLGNNAAVGVGFRFGKPLF